MNHAAMVIQRGWKSWRSYRTLVQEHKQCLMVQAYHLGRVTRETQIQLRNTVCFLQAQSRARLQMRMLDAQINSVCPLLLFSVSVSLLLLGCVSL